MNIDNKKRASKIKLVYMAVPLMLVLITGSIYLFGHVRNLGWLFLATALFVAYFFVMAYFKYNYISFYAGPDKIRLRYKSLSPFPGNNNSIQIPIELFHDYQLILALKGYKKGLVLFQKSPGGIARYQMVSLSALSGAEVNQLVKALELAKALAKARN
jgi:hypothetical protein